MAYKPSLDDINGIGYSPSIEDLPEESAVQKLTKSLQENEEVPQKRTPQMQEEFSNPTNWPGFENLPKEEQLKRIQLSGIDPANQTPMGTFVPPGTFENPATRMAASVLPTFLAPEASFSNPLLRSSINALSRIGAGTAGNIAYESPNIKSFEDLKNVGSESAKFNALLELIPGVAKLIRGGSEIYNPSVRYAAFKANQIKNEAQAARALQKETYNPVFEKYGKSSVTRDPKNYMFGMGIDPKKLYPEARKTYDEFLKNPTFQNLHDFQSQLGKDYRLTSAARNKPKTTQVFNQYRENAKDAAQRFLSRDKPALDQYNKGSEITKNVVEPFYATPTLQKISEGTKQNLTPKQLSSAIQKGREKILYGRGNNIKTAIPKNHSLTNHMQDIENRMSMGEALQSSVPKLLKEMLPNFVGATQNKLINKSFENLSPFYYGAGRASIYNNK